MIKKYNYEYFEDGITPKRVSVNPEFEKIRKQKRYEILYKFSGIPILYEDLDFSNFETQIEKSKDSFEKCKKYATNCLDEKFKNISLYLYGPNSTAKTTIACAIGKEFMRNGLYVKFVLAGNLIDYLMSNQGFNTEEISSNYLKEFNSCDLIIIDDAFDTAKALTWKSANSNMIIQEWDRFYRHNISQGTRFIVTSNKSPNSIFTEFGQSLYELVDRNFVDFEFTDNIKYIRKRKLLEAFR